MKSFSNVFPHFWYCLNRLSIGYSTFYTSNLYVKSFLSKLCERRETQEHCQTTQKRMFYVLSSKNLVPDAVSRVLLIDDFALIRHVLLELSNSKDLQMKAASDRQLAAQDVGLLFDTTLSSFPDK